MPSAIVDMAKMVVSAVISTGRMRVRPVSRMASVRSMPASRSWLMLSTNTIPLFTTTPARTREAQHSNDGKLAACEPQRKQAARKCQRDREHHDKRAHQALELSHHDEINEHNSQRDHFDKVRHGAVDGFHFSPAISTV